MSPKKGKNNKWPRFLALLLPMISCAAALAPVPLHGQACGDTITMDTTLTSDIGPCPNNGLEILASSITLNLNGFTISGSAGGIGVRLPSVIHEVTIQGPGTITNFAAGIDSHSGDLRIQDLTLRSNGSGIQITQSGPFRIINNIIDQASVGIAAIQTASGKIKGNTIRGTGVGISMRNSGGPTVIIQNQVNGNGTGLSTHQDFPIFPNAPITILSNDFSNNTLDGAVLDSNTLTMWLNTLNGNGRDGVLITGQLGTNDKNLFQDNVADNNGNRGIALANVQGNSNARITDNEALGNVLDLFWDGTGNGNCWKFNTFQTSDPATLPMCGVVFGVEETQPKSTQ